MHFDRMLKICIFTIFVLTLLFPVGGFVMLPLALALAIASGKSRLLLKAFKEDVSIFLLACSYAASIFSSRLLPLSIIAAGLVVLQLVYLSLVKSVMNRKDLRIWYNLMNITAILVCMIALFQFASGHLNQYASWVDQKSFGELKRVYSTLYNPNIFAGFLAINLAWGISKQMVNKADSLTSANIIMSSLCLILTYSRGGFLALCAAVSVIFIFTGRKRLLLYIGAMAVGFYIANHTGAVNRFDYSSVMADSSNTYRLEIWKAGIKMFMERPLFGNGIGTAWVLLSAHSDVLYRYVLHAHNIFIQTAAETGIAGTAALVYFFVRNTKQAIDGFIKTKNEEVSFVFLGFAASLASILVHGMIDAVIMLPTLSMLFIGYYAMYSIVYKASTGRIKELQPGISFYEEEIA